ncbi:hypothetical protein Q427_22600 [Halomonas sp. BC04]|nr:hypothetical protein Q427_22600 [Halomonas sp. BC04]
MAKLPADSHALVLTHDHAEDRELVDGLLRRGDMASIGLIGSKSKWASFRSRLTDAGHDEAALDGVRCPIGVASGGTGGDKTPYAIAIAAMAELLPLVGSAERADQRGLDPAQLRTLFSEPSP